MSAAVFAACWLCTQPTDHHGVAHHLPSMHTVLLQAVCILVEGCICRCTASNAVLCLIAVADADKNLVMHLQLELGSVKSLHAVAEQMMHSPQ